MHKMRIHMTIQESWQCNWSPAWECSDGFHNQTDDYSFKHKPPPVTTGFTSVLMSQSPFSLSSSLTIASQATVSPSEPRREHSVWRQWGGGGRMPIYLKIKARLLNLALTSHNSDLRFNLFLTTSEILTKNTRRDCNY